MATAPQTPAVKEKVKAATKEYTVLKTVKMNGVEHGPGETVDIEPGRAAKLLGLFVEAASAKTAKTGDGL